MLDWMLVPSPFLPLAPPSFLILCAVNIFQVAFAAADSVTGLKLIEAGLSSEKIALIGIPLVPVQIMLPWIIR